jgi:hypothetical protein
MKMSLFKYITFDGHGQCDIMKLLCNHSWTRGNYFFHKNNYKNIPNSEFEKTVNGYISEKLKPKPIQIK